MHHSRCIESCDEVFVLELEPIERIEHALVQSAFVVQRGAWYIGIIMSIIRSPILCDGLKVWGKILASLPNYYRPVLSALTVRIVAMTTRSVACCCG